MNLKPEINSSTQLASKGVAPRAGIEPEVVQARRTSLPQLVSSLASTMVARQGTSSALGYVASGIGAVINNVIGVDPINAGQVNSIIRSIQMWF